MIESYAFFAVFLVQILAMSIVYPVRFSRYVRVQTTSIPTERLARLYPGVDFDLARERFLTRYRVVNTGIAVLGLLLFGWLFGYMRRPSWDEDAAIGLISVYYLLQIAPLLFVSWLGFRFNKAHKSALLETKRKATLQRRGLFDFISPYIVLVAVAGYFLFAVFVIYMQPKPMPGFGLIGALTLCYALLAFNVYRALYGTNSNPLETPARRVHTIGMTVKVCVYSCIVCVVFFAFTFTVDLLELKRWMPLAQSVCLLITTLLCFMGMASSPSQPGADRFDSKGGLTPGARDLSA